MNNNFTKNVLSKLLIYSVHDAFYDLSSGLAEDHMQKNRISLLHNIRLRKSRAIDDDWRRNRANSILVVYPYLASAGIWMLRVACFP